MVLQTRSTDVISVVKFDARTEVVPGFHVVKPGTAFHAAAFTKTAVTNLPADPIRAGRTRNEQRRRQNRCSCTSNSESAHERSSFTISLGKERPHGDKGPGEKNLGNRKNVGTNVWRKSSACVTRLPLSRTFVEALRTGPDGTGESRRGRRFK